MQDKERDLSVYRLSLSKETLANASLCRDNKFYRDCINRSYYAAFYSIKAIEDIDFKRHKDAVAYFNKTYVATGVFSRAVGKRLGRIKTMREESGYSDFLWFLKKMQESSMKQQSI